MTCRKTASQAGIAQPKETRAKCTRAASWGPRRGGSASWGPRRGGAAPWGGHVVGGCVMGGPRRGAASWGVLCGTHVPWAPPPAPFPRRGSLLLVAALSGGGCLGLTSKWDSSQSIP